MNRKPYRDEVQALCGLLTGLAYGGLALALTTACIASYALVL